MTNCDWNRLLQQWNDALLYTLDLAEYEGFPELDITPEVVASGWLGYPGATEEQIGALEQRLRITLPPSYRAFLRISNGFRLPGNIVPRLLSTDEVAWSRDYDPNPFSHFIEAYISAWDDPDEIPDREFYVTHLPATLQISIEELGGSAIYLLDPLDVNADGEWEALWYAAWDLGAAQCGSFWDLMQKEYQDFVQMED